MEEGTTEVLSAAGTLLAIMPEPAPTKKRTGFGPHFLQPLGPESFFLDPAAECVEANNSKAQTASQQFFRQKSGQVLVRTHVLKYVEFPKVIGGMSGVLVLGNVAGSPGSHLARANPI